MGEAKWRVLPERMKPKVVVSSSQQFNVHVALPAVKETVGVIVLGTSQTKETVVK